MARRTATAPKPETIEEPAARGVLVDLVDEHRRGPAEPDLAERVERLERRRSARRRPLTADEVAALPRSPRRLHAPLPEAPGGVYLAAPAGAPCPPGGVELDELTRELAAAHQRYERWLRLPRDVEAKREHVANLEEMASRLAERIAEQRAELEQLERDVDAPPELMVSSQEWTALARRAIERCGYRPVPHDLQSIPERAAEMILRDQAAQEAQALRVRFARAVGA